MADAPGHIVLPNDDVDTYAIQALFKGEASPDQQIRALKCIIEEICGTYNMTFDPESARWSDFNEGKRHVGRTLVNLSTINVGAIKQALQKRKAPLVKSHRRRDKGAS
jgi:hypothetical protein